MLKLTRPPLSPEQLAASRAAQEVRLAELDRRSIARLAELKEISLDEAATRFYEQYPARRPS
mgnify:CR=1 FL=1